jgi:TolB-like protein
MLFLAFGCVTVDQNDESFLLEEGVKQASGNIIENIDEKTKIAFLYFSSDSEVFSEYIIEELLTNLINSKKFTIVDRKYLDQVRDELNLQLSGEVSDDSVQSIGKFIGAQSILIGSIQKIGNSYKLRFNTIAVETAERQAAYSFNLSSKDKQAYALLATTTGTSGKVSARQQKKSYFEGNGGAGIFLTVSNTIETQNFSKEDMWLLDYMKGTIENTIKTYSNVAVLVRDRSALKAQSDEINLQMSGFISDDSVVSIGRAIGAKYLLTGTITKIPNNEFSIKMIILNVESGMQNAIFTKIFSLQEIRNEVAIRRICFELLKQMSIVYTDLGEKAILNNN